MIETKIEAVVEDILSVNPLLFRRLFNPRLVKGMMAPATHIAMMILKERGSMSMTEIGKCLYMPKPNVTALVDKLIADNLVERIADEKDRRIILIRATKKGLKTMDDIKTVVKASIRKKIMLLNEEDLCVLSVSLENVKSVLSKLPIEN